MSKTLRTIAYVAVAVAIVATTGSLQGALAFYSTAQSIDQTLSQKKPALKGSVSQVAIGATMPIPYMMGRTYTGGMQVFDNSAGTENRRRWNINVVSGAGPIEEFETLLADYEPISFAPDGDGDNAVGWFHDFMYRDWKVGSRPETAFEDDLPSIPGWTSAHKLSGYAAYKVKMKFDKDGKRFASGIPQLGVVAKGVKVYDPRLDDTYPGGVGSHRWDDEATWEWSDNPALHGLAYLRGRFANGVKIIGAGIPKDAIDIASFVEMANVNEANEWTVGGLVYEAPDLSKWDNLKRILQSGGAKPVWSGGLLRAVVSAPRPSLFNITGDDLAEGSVEVRAMKGWRDRRNSIVPKYRAEDHKWEYVQGDAVTASTYLTEDGELKTEEVQFDLVQDKDQAAQLAAYELANGREFGPITFTVKPRLLAYQVGEAGTVHIPEAGLFNQLAVITGRSVNPANGAVSLTLESETTAKHAYALGMTGTAPPTPTIRTAEELDLAVTEEGAGQTALLIANSGPRVLALSINAAAEITVSGHERVYSDKTVMVTGATIITTGAVADDLIAVYYDDLARTGGTVTYQYTVIPDGIGEIAEYYASSVNPGRHFVALLPVPATGTTSGGSGVGPGTGGTGSGVGGGGNQPDTVLE